MYTTDANVNDIDDDFALVVKTKSMRRRQEM
jgi:hypothetical protein